MNHIPRNHLPSPTTPSHQKTHSSQASPSPDQTLGHPKFPTLLQTTNFAPSINPILQYCARNCKFQNQKHTQIAQPYNQRYLYTQNRQVYILHNQTICMYIVYLCTIQSDIPWLFYFIFSFHFPQPSPCKKKKKKKEQHRLGEHICVGDYSIHKKG